MADSELKLALAAGNLPVCRQAIQLSQMEGEDPMNQSVPELLRQGLIITAIGMTLVFAVLGLLWGIMALLTRVFREAAPAVRSAPGW